MEQTDARVTIYIDEYVSQQLAHYIVHERDESDAVVQEELMNEWVKRAPVVIDAVDELTTLTAPNVSRNNLRYNGQVFGVREKTKRLLTQQCRRTVGGTEYKVRHLHTALAVDTLCRVHFGQKR